MRLRPDFSLFRSGLVEKDFEEIAVYIDRAIRITANIKKANPTDKLADFKAKIVSSPPAELKALADEVEAWSMKFAMPGQIM